MGWTPPFFCFAVNEQKVLEGVADFREQMAAEAGQTLGEIMTENIISLNRHNQL